MQLERQAEPPVPVPGDAGTYRRRCPRCNKGRSDDALAVTVEHDGHCVWLCHRCGWRGTTRQGRTGARRRGRREARPATVAAHPTQPAADDPRRERARRLWREAQPAKGTLVETYLRARGLHLPNDALLGFIPSAWHWKERVWCPAMIAPLVAIGAPDGTEPCAAHLTFLAADGSGKAAVKPDRLYVAGWKGCVVKVTPDSEVTTGLAIAEGIETALAVHHAGFPTWATTASAGVAGFPVLPGVEAISVFADRDSSGLKAAQQCADRWSDAGKEARIITPPYENEDWLDAAQRAAGRQ